MNPYRVVLTDFTRHYIEENRVYICTLHRRANVIFSSFGDSSVISNISHCLTVILSFISVDRDRLKR